MIILKVETKIPEPRKLIILKLEEGIR